MAKDGCSLSKRNRHLFSEQERATKDVDEWKALWEDGREADAETWALLFPWKEKTWKVETRRIINS